MALVLFVNIAGFVMPMAGTQRSGLSVQLATVPAAPTVSMVVRRQSEYEKVAKMPSQLAEWGCDKELWTNLRASGRKSLKKLARSGQADNAREVIASLRAVVEREAAASAPTEKRGGGRTDAQVDPVAVVPAAKALEEEATPSAEVESQEPSVVSAPAEVGVMAPEGFSWGATF